MEDQQPYALSYEVPCVPAFANNFHSFLTLKYFQWCLSTVSLCPLTKVSPYQTFKSSLPMSQGIKKSPVLPCVHGESTPPSSCCYGQKAQCVCCSLTAAPSAALPTAHQPTPTSVLNWHGKGCTLMGITCIS